MVMTLAQDQERSMVDRLNARRVMVDNQIRTFDVTDQAVLAAFERVPRELFVEERDRANAYSDRMLVVGEGKGQRALLVPLVLARLIQALQPRAGEKALDVLGGLGYSAVILAAIGLETTFLEADPTLTEGARVALGKAEELVKVAEFSKAQAKVTVKAAEPMLSAKAVSGLPQSGFDVILVNGASECEPKSLFPALAEGGRLGIIAREGNAARAIVYVKSGGIVSPRRVFDAQAPVLPGFMAEPAFVF
jgi:protein-L-isoaspartate(D-aspartate) O-methyltransferase